MYAPPSHQIPAPIQQTLITRTQHANIATLRVHLQAPQYNTEGYPAVPREAHPAGVQYCTTPDSTRHTNKHPTDLAATPKRPSANEGYPTTIHTAPKKTRTPRHTDSPGTQSSPLVKTPQTTDAQAPLQPTTAPHSSYQKNESKIDPAATFLQHHRNQNAEPKTNQHISPGTHTLPSASAIKIQSRHITKAADTPTTHTSASHTRAAGEYTKHRNTQRNLLEKPNRSSTESTPDLEFGHSTEITPNPQSHRPNRHTKQQNSTETTPKLKTQLPTNQQHTSTKTPPKAQPHRLYLHTEQQQPSTKNSPKLQPYSPNRQQQINTEPALTNTASSFKTQLSIEPPSKLQSKTTPTAYNPRLSITGKLPKPYHHFPHLTSRTNKKKTYPQHNHITHTKSLKTTCMVCNNYNHTTISSNLLYKARLHAQEGGGDKSTPLKKIQNTSYHCAQQMANRGKAVHEAIMKSPMDTNTEDMEDTMMIETTQTKRTQEAKKGSSSSKRKKSTDIATGLKETPKEFWLGIVAMEKLAIDEGIKTKDCRLPFKKEDLIGMGISEGEAEELCHPHKIAFPHVKQLLYPLERPDGKGGQHFNLTQLPIETEVDPGTGLSLDYHIAVYFERPSTDYTHNEICTMATARLACMNIEIGIGLAEPIYIPCKEKEKNSKIKFWTGTIKIHLKHPREDGIGMLKGLRPFILTLDKIQTLGKVCKCYDSIARNTLLSTKIENPKLHLISASELQRDVLLESFRRGYDYEIASVQKVKEETWGWLISTTPTQANRIIQYLVPYKQELMHVITPQAAKDERRSRGEGLTEDEIKKKNATMLCLYGLHKMKKVEDTKDSIKAVIGGLNVASFYFPGQVGDLHKGTANVQCLNAIVYRQWVGKTIEIFGKHVSFTPHPKSLQGAIPPTKEEQEKLGFCDISTAIADTLEATRNAPQIKGKGSMITHDDLDALVGTAMDKRNGQLIIELKTELTAEIHKEMGDFKKEVALEADVREERITRNLTTHVKNQLTEIRKQLALTSQAVNMTTKALDSILAPPQPQLEN